MRDHVVIEQLKIGATEFAIAVPPHRFFGERIDDDVLVLGAAAGVGAGLGAEGAALNQRAFAVSDRVLHQNGVGQIPMDAGEIFETELLGAIGAIPHTRFHLSLRFALALAGRFLAPAELPERPPPLHSSASRARRRAATKASGAIPTPPCGSGSRTSCGRIIPPHPAAASPTPTGRTVSRWRATTTSPSSLTVRE